MAHKNTLIASAALISVLGAATLASARETIRKPWPTPAAGESKSGGPEVLFTFDDGPHETYTPLILDYLAEYNVQALFFWVGHRVLKDRKARKRRVGIVEQAVVEGHVIGSHTVNHEHLCSVKRRVAEDEIDIAHETYTRLSGLPTLHFRAPYGDRCRQLVELLENRGLDHLHWDIDPREWLHHDSARTASYIIGKLRRLEGRAVILMHDTKKATAKALPVVLKWIKEENKRRIARSEKPIRILGVSDWIAESFDSATLEFGKLAIRELAALSGRTLKQLTPGLSNRALTRR